MGLTCRELMLLPSLKSLELVGGDKGLERVVDWVYFADVISNLSDSINWINGNEMLIVTGSAMNGQYDQLLRMLPALEQQRISGVIINVGPYFGEISRDVIDLADELALPIFKLPWDQKLVDITRAICNAVINDEIAKQESDNVMDALLYNQTLPQEQLAPLLMRAGYHSDYRYRVVLACVNVEQTPQSDKLSRELRAMLLYYANLELNRRTPKTIVSCREDTCVFLTPDDTEANLTATLQNLVNAVTAQYANAAAYIGVGKPYKDPVHLPKSYRQAEQMLLQTRMAQTGSVIEFYKDTNIYNLLFSISDHELLTQFESKTLMPLREYDKANNTQLLPTLESYLTNNMLVQETADRLFVHKNTLKYRLTKIEELLGCDIHTPAEIAKLYLALQIATMLTMDRH